MEHDEYPARPHRPHERHREPVPLPLAHPGDSREARSGARCDQDDCALRGRPDPTGPARFPRSHRVAGGSAVGECCDRLRHEGPRVNSRIVTEADADALKAKLGADIDSWFAALKTTDGPPPTTPPATGRA